MMGKNPITIFPLNVQENKGKLLITRFIDPMYESDEEQETNNDDGNGNNENGVDIVSNNNSVGGMTREFQKYNLGQN